MKQGENCTENLFWWGEKYEGKSPILVMNEVNVNERSEFVNIAAGHFPLAAELCNISCLLFVWAEQQLQLVYFRPTPKQVVAPIL